MTGGGEEWFYLDSTGQEFGPFHSDTMRDWFGQGFFPIGFELLVRTKEWKKHVPLRQCYSENSKAFVGPPRQPNQNRARGNSGRSGRGSHSSGSLDNTHAYSPTAMLDMLAQPPFPGLGVGGIPVPNQFGQQYWMMPSPGAAFSAPPAGFGMQPFGSQGVTTSSRFQGRIKSYNAKQGFGFVDCPQTHGIFGRDIFLHKAQIGDFKVGTEVTFGVEPNKQGMPQARDVIGLDGVMPGPVSMSAQKGGGNFGGGFGGGNFQGAMGGGGGRGRGQNKGSGKGKRNNSKNNGAGGGYSN